MKKSKFPKQKVIGDHVRFTHVVVHDYNPFTGGRRERVVYEMALLAAQHAVITGAKLIYAGYSHSGSYDEPNYFEPVKGTWVYTARQGFSNAEIYLPTSGPNIPTLTCCREHCFSFRKVDAGIYDERFRQELREAALKQSRDPRTGRFIRGGA